MAVTEEFPFVEKEFAMRGDGYYNRNSDIQQAAILPALKLLPNLSDRSEITVVDYGCSQGGNSIIPIRQLLSTLPDHATANVIFNDRPRNDFSTLATTINAHKTSIDPRGSLVIYPAMAPTSFFNQVVRSASVDIGVSWTSFNYLERQSTLPPTLDHKEHFKQVIAHNANQAHGDLVKLFRLRAAEIKPGGCLVAAVLGRNTNATPSVGIIDESMTGIQRAMSDTFQSMVQSGRLTQQQVMAIDLPSYERSMDECQAALAEVADLWNVEHHFDQIVTHPAYTVLQEKKKLAGQDESKAMEASHEYAGKLANTFLATLSVFLINGLRALAEVDNAMPWTSEEVSLLDYFNNQMTEALLKNHRDGKLELRYLYFKLVRK